MKKLALLASVSCFLVLPAYAGDGTTHDPSVAHIDGAAGNAHGKHVVAVEPDKVEAVVEVAEPATELESAAVPVPEAVPTAAPEVVSEVVTQTTEEKALEVIPADVVAVSAPVTTDVCKDGEKQSPINIAKFLQEDLPALNAAYQKSPLSVTNNGTTVHVDFEGGGGFSLNGVNYTLSQAEFRTPSEHYLDGAPYPMEAQFAHNGSDGSVSVVSVMLKVGEHNPVIEGVWQNVPAKGESKTVEGVEIAATDLMPGNLDYYTYEGSLTTSPCTEGVHWHVIKEPIELSAAQLRAFQSVFAMNARPVQPLNGRIVTGD